MKREMIFNDLRRNIIAGITPPGTKLPTELELSVQYGVARDTLRDSLKKLEEEGLIERIKSRGTFVRQPEKDSGERVISFLIPYPEYLQNRPLSFRHFSDLFYGAVRAASEQGWRVQTIPFSQNNDNRNIDWEALSCLRRDSRLIVFGQWYNTVFKALMEREVRVGFVRMFGPHLKSPWDSFLSEWINGIFDLQKCLDSTLRCFHMHGCRKLLYLGGYLDDPLNELNLTCRKVSGELGMKFFRKDIFTESNRMPEFPAVLRKSWEDCRADAVIVDVGGRFQPQDGFQLYREAGIPGSVKLVMFRDDPAYLKTCPQISAFALNHDLMGFNVAKALMEETYSPRRLFQEVEFINRESSGGPHESSAKPKTEVCHEPFSYHI